MCHKLLTDSRDGRYVSLPHTSQCVTLCLRPSVTWLHFPTRCKGLSWCWVSGRYTNQLAPALYHVTACSVPSITILSNTAVLTDASVPQSTGSAVQTGRTFPLAFTCSEHSSPYGNWATGCAACCSNPDKVRKFFSSLRRPDRF